MPGNLPRFLTAENAENPISCSAFQRFRSKNYPRNRPMSLFFNDPRVKALFADARNGSISIDRIDNLVRYEKLKPGVIDEMLTIAVGHKEDLIVMQWLASHPNLDGDPVRWIATKAASGDMFTSRVLGAMVTKNPSLIKLINSLPSNCSSQYLQSCAGDKNGK